MRGKVMNDGQRNIVIQTLELNLSSFDFFANSVTQSESQTLRDVKTDGSDGWTVLEVMSHLRDVEEQLLKRLECALENSDKTFPVFKPEELAISESYNEGSLDSVMIAFKENRKILFTAYQAIKPEQWDYTGLHSSRGTTSVADLLLQTAWHDAKHVRQLSRMFSRHQK